MTSLSVEQAERFAEMVLAAVAREYPNKILHALSSDADVRPPRQLTPAFFGAFDWHSAVHGHWTLVRLMRCFPGAAFEARARDALGAALSPAKLAGELDYLAADGRSGFEVPYGMGWLLTLDAELARFADPSAPEWRESLEPLARLAAERVERYAETLPYPVRSGEHTQTAFGLALYLDWARVTGADATRVAARTLELYGDDHDTPLHFEPSGYDFLSPSLSEADLMRRVLEPEAYAEWLSRFMPSLASLPDGLFEPVSCPDPADAKLAHLDGLNLSRAWMLEGMRGGLPHADARCDGLARAAASHRDKGLAAVTGEHYAGSHWQGTFAVYLATRLGTE